MYCLKFGTFHIIIQNISTWLSLVCKNHSEFHSSLTNGNLETLLIAKRPEKKNVPKIYFFKLSQKKTEIAFNWKFCLFFNLFKIYISLVHHFHNKIVPNLEVFNANVILTSYFNFSANFTLECQTESHSVK